MEGVVEVIFRVELGEVELTNVNLTWKKRFGDLLDAEGFASARRAKDRYRERACLRFSAVFKDKVADAAEIFYLLAVYRE